MLLRQDGVPGVATLWLQIASGRTRRGEIFEARATGGVQVEV